ncbi:MAG: hypothetical protein ABR497_12515, partial [Kiritimatiellia bacterium]
MSIPGLRSGIREYSGTLTRSATGSAVIGNECLTTTKGTNHATANDSKKIRIRDLNIGGFVDS